MSRFRFGLGKKNELVLSEEEWTGKVTKKHNYTIIDITPNGKPNWWKGARTMLFVYSKHSGNFILRGFFGDVSEYLQENYTHYFYYASMWCDGETRGSWYFWKDGVSIFTPNGKPNDRKYRIRQWSWRMKDDKEYKEVILKRLPKRWIPEFNQF